MTLSYEFGLKKPVPAVPAAPAEGKDVKGGDKEVASNSGQIAKQITGCRMLDGVKVTLGVNNVTNAKPVSLPDSPDSTNTDAALYDPFQRYYYVVVSKKF
jgi:hypothetical protein